MVVKWSEVPTPPPPDPPDTPPTHQLTPSPPTSNYQTVGMWSICGGVVTPSFSHCSFSPLTSLVMPPQCMINTHTLPSTFVPCAAVRLCYRAAVYARACVCARA